MPRAGPLLKSLVPVAALALALPAQTREIDALVRQLGSSEPERRAEAASALFERGTEAAVPLAKALDSATPEARSLALRVLVELGPAATAALPALLELWPRDWRDPSLQETVHHLALFTPPDTVPPRGWEHVAAAFAFDGHAPVARLLDRLEDSEEHPLDYQELYCTAAAIAARTTDIADALAAEPARRPTTLSRLAAMATVRTGRRSEMQAWAARALARLDPWHPEAAAGHALELALHPSREARLRALHSLAGLGAAPLSVRQILQTALRDPDSRIVAEVITTIGTLARETDGLAGHLQPFLASEDPALADRARAALYCVAKAGGDLQLAISYFDNGVPASHGAMRETAMTGAWRFWHANGNEKSRGAYEAGREHGPWMFWHGNGAVAAEGSYAHGVQAGPWTFRHDNGVTAKVGAYRDGAPAGTWTFFHRNGRKASEGELGAAGPVGAWLHWDPQGRPIAAGQ